VGAVLLSSAALSPRFAARRYRMTTGVVGLLVVVGGLGWAALGPRLPTTVAAQPSALADYGQALFMAKGCNSCHLHDQALNDWSTETGPNLTTYQNTAEYLHVWLKDPQAIKPNTEMPNLALKRHEIEALTAFLIKPKK
jgi:cytochrome c2